MKWIVNELMLRNERKYLKTKMRVLLFLISMLPWNIRSLMNEESTHSEENFFILRINIKHVYASRELRKSNILLAYGESHCLFYSLEGIRKISLTNQNNLQRRNLKRTCSNFNTNEDGLIKNWAFESSQQISMGLMTRYCQK